MFHKRFFCRTGKNISAIPHFAVWRIFMLYHSSIFSRFYNGVFSFAGCIMGTRFCAAGSFRLAAVFVNLRLI